MQPIIVRADFSKAIILRLFGRAADWLLLHKPFTRAKGAALDGRPESLRARGGSGGTRPCDCAAPSLHLTHPSLSQRAAQRAAQIKISRLSACLQIHLEYGLAQKTMRIANCHYILLRASICVLNYYWSDRLLTVRTQQQPIILCTCAVDLCEFTFSAYTQLIDRMERNQMIKANTVIFIYQTTYEIMRCWIK